MNEKQCCGSKGLIGSAGLAVIAGGIAGRIWIKSWGATRKERKRRWPGDELVGKGAYHATHALTIDATSSEIWPWLLQIGQDRGGFYSYTWLENLAGCQMRNADQIIPEFQHRSVGDSVWMTTPRHYGGAARMTVAQVIPQRALVLVAPENPRITQRDAHDGTWSLYLEPVDATHTRLIVRGLSRRPMSSLFRMAHFIMERKMMLEIKRLAERDSAGRTARAA